MSKDLPRGFLEQNGPEDGHAVSDTGGHRALPRAIHLQQHQSQ